MSRGRIRSPNSSLLLLRPLFVLDSAEVVALVRFPPSGRSRFCSGAMQSQPVQHARKSKGRVSS